MNKRCDNCGAEIPVEKMGKDSQGRNICCAACIFDPMGCRCKYGEYGVVETYSDPDFPEFGADDEFNYQ
jgi:ribosomal protein S26